MDLIDIDKCPIEFLPQLCAMYGYEYTLELPELFQRRLLKYIVELYKRKGTKSVVRFIARELSGYESEIIENKDFTPYDVEVTGWTVEFRNYRNFILKLTAPYGNYNMASREEIVVKLVNQFLPTNSQAFIITSYWFDDESNFIPISKDFGEYDTIVDVTRYEFPSTLTTEQELGIPCTRNEGFEESNVVNPYADAYRVMMNIDLYDLTPSTSIIESPDTSTVALATELEIVPEGSTTFNTCDIMGEKNEVSFQFEDIDLMDYTSRLNVSSGLVTNVISGFDIIKESGKPDVIIVI